MFTISIRVTLIQMCVSVCVCVCVCVFVFVTMVLTDWNTAFPCICNSLKQSKIFWQIETSCFIVFLTDWNTLFPCVFHKVKNLVFLRFLTDQNTSFCVFWTESKAYCILIIMFLISKLIENIVTYIREFNQLVCDVGIWS